MLNLCVYKFSIMCYDLMIEGMLVSIYIYIWAYLFFLVLF